MNVIESMRVSGGAVERLAPSAALHARERRRVREAGAVGCADAALTCRAQSIG